MPHLRLAAPLAALLLALSAQAQPALRSPEAFLGYELGSRFTPHHLVLDYVEHVAAVSPNVRLERYGETYEGRPLVVLYVTAPENLDRLEAIRRAHLRRAGLEAPQRGSDGEADADAPAVVWLSYNVHGNEAASTEAAMATLFDLADPDDARTQAWLARTVVVLDPCVNPDGRERYVQWYRQTRGRVPDPTPAAREHDEPWPGGRTNHYYFDLNRDWAWGVQLETQQRLPLYQRWMPHVHVDFHEQRIDEPYYFAPAAEPFHPAITEWQRRFQTTIGEANAELFDARSWLYFTGEVFDLFYPGYGDTWPTFNGAVGMTYEQGGSGRAGLAVRTAEGDTLTLAERVAHHHAAGLSTIATVARHREAVVQEFVRFFDRARTGPSGPYASFVAATAGDPDARAALAAHLDAQGIRYGFAATAREARGFRYRQGDEGPVRIEAGDLIVSTAQPRGVLARVLFEPRTELADSVTYDITAWTLPHVYGIDAYALPARLEADAAAPPPAATPPSVDRPYAYLAEWKSPEDLRFLTSVLREQVRVRFAGRRFEAAGRSFDAGTLILTRAGNERLGDAFDRIVQEAARALDQPLWTASTGFTTRGADFGSGSVSHLRPPRVALLSGHPVSAYALGEIWHFFDRQIEYPVTLVDAAEIDEFPFDAFDVLILPDGAYEELLTTERLDRLKTWIREGGRLVALEGAVEALAGREGFDVTEKEAQASAEDSVTARLESYGGRERRDVSASVSGSIYRVQLDATHPLAFGYSDVYFTLKRSADAFAFLEDGWNVGVIRTAAPENGFAGFRAREKLQDSLTFGVQEMGDGRVVYLVDDPLFRGFWYGGRLLFANAVFLVGQ